MFKLPFFFGTLTLPKSEVIVISLQIERPCKIERTSWASIASEAAGKKTTP